MRHKMSDDIPKDAEGMRSLIESLSRSDCKFMFMLSSN